MPDAIIFKWLKPYFLETDEMEDLAEAAGYNVMHKIVWRGEKPHKEHFIPDSRLEKIVKMRGERDDITLLIEGFIHPYQLVELESQSGCTVLDKVMLVLEIFEKKASSKDVLLQIELAKLIYTSPIVQSTISKNVETERQALERGVGEQITSIAKSNINHRIARIRKQIEEMRNKGTPVYNDETVLRIPIMGFYSAGKSTLFNIITGLNQEIDQEAFTTMFSKIARADMFGYPLDIVDTVGLVDLPDNVLNAFNAMLKPLFSAPLIVVAIDSSLLLDEFDYQISHLGKIARRFLDKELPKFLVIHTKSDLAEESTYIARTNHLSSFEWLGDFRELRTTQDEPELIREQFLSTLEEMLEGELLVFKHDSVAPGGLSRMYDIARIEDVAWNTDGTCSVQGVTLKSLQHLLDKYINT